LSAANYLFSFSHFASVLFWDLLKDERNSKIKKKCAVRSFAPFLGNHQMNFFLVPSLLNASRSGDVNCSSFRFDFSSR